MFASARTRARRPRKLIYRTQDQPALQRTEFKIRLPGLTISFRCRQALDSDQEQWLKNHALAIHERLTQTLDSDRDDNRRPVRARKPTVRRLGLSAASTCQFGAHRIGVAEAVQLLQRSREDATAKPVFLCIACDCRVTPAASGGWQFFRHMLGSAVCPLKVSAPPRTRSARPARCDPAPVASEKAGR